MAAPTLSSVQLSTATVDLTRRDATAMFTVRANDAGGDLSRIVITLDAAVLAYAPVVGVRGDITAGGNYLTSSVTVFPGMFANGTPYQYPVTQSGDSYGLGLLIEPGTAGRVYTITGVTLTDAAGASSSYTRAEIAALGGTTSFTVLADTGPPELQSYSLPTAVVLTEGYAQTVAQGGASATDASTGVRSIVMQFDAAVGTASTGQLINTLTFSQLQATFSDLSVQGPLLFGGSVPVGLKQLIGVTVTDQAGNVASYTPAELAARGLATSLLVTRVGASDFNADGGADILFRNVGGSISAWTGTGTGATDAFVKGTFNAAVDASWRVVDTFDYNRDGATDLVWRNGNGALAVWTAAGSGFRQSAYLDTSVGTEWRIAAAGDVSGDQRGDLVWQRTDGTVSVWQANANGGFDKNLMSLNLGSSAVVGVGDFNRDPFKDLLVRAPDGTLTVWISQTTSFQQQSNGAPVDRAWHVAGIGDITGDGLDDLVWRNDDGRLSVWAANGDFQGGFVQNQLNAFASTDWRIAATGDYNRDARADILWRNDATGALSIWHSTGTGWQVNSFYDGSVGTNWTIAAHDFV